MTESIADPTGTSVNRLAGRVVLTMTPHRARVLATSIWLADRTQWLDVLADELSAAAEQPGTLTDRTPAAIEGSVALVARNPTTTTADPDPADPEDRLQVTVESAFIAALAREVDVEMRVARGLEAAATAAALLAVEAVAAAADRTALAAEAASDVRAVATARSAAAIAETVRETATAVRLRADEEAERVAGAASDVASLVAQSPSAQDVDAVARATLVASGVSAAAVLIAQEVAAQATMVARAAATAAMEAAAAAADAAMALELTVRSTAVEVQTVASLAARRVAGETERAVGVATAAR